MRSVSLSTSVVLTVLASSVAFAQGGTQSLSLTNYQFVSEQRYSLTSSYVTYRADLVNPGAALASATAKVTGTTDPTNVQIVAGKDTLTFGAVPANGQVTSTNTFTILVNRTVQFDFNKLQWTFQGVPVAPIANPGPNQSATVGQTVTLNGSGSTNPSGIGTLTYSWAFKSRPAGSSATISNANNVIATFVPDVQGSYVITLTVNNGQASNSADVTVSTTTSPPPVAKAGPDQTVNVGATVVLNGSGSTSGSGNPLTYAWTLTQVPAGSTAALTGANTVSPTFVADKAGTYKAQLMVNDGVASSAPSTVTITTQTVKPVANAGPNQQVNIGSVVQLNGSGSTDANGLPLTYSWTLITRPAGSAATLSNPNIVNPTFTVDAQGTYVAQLIVNNGTLSSDPATVTITTNTVQAPTANAGPNQTVNGGSVVTLAGSGTDPQGLPLTFKWSLITKPAGSAATLSSTVIANPTFTADLAGTYVAQLIVNNGFLDSAPATVTISTTCAPPTANPGSNQTVQIGATVTLNGSASGDVCHDPLTYAWSFTSRPNGSNATLTGANTVSPTFVADVAGMYVVQLIVNNGFSNSTPATVTVTANPLPAITVPNTTVGVGQQASLTISVPQNVTGSNLTVNLSSSDTSKATVPASVTIPVGSNSATVQVTGVNIGSATITASATGYNSGTGTVTVPAPTMTFSGSPLSVNVGATGNLTINLTGGVAPPGGLTINLTSSDTSKVTVPASVNIAAGGNSASVQVTGVAATTSPVTITAAATGLANATAQVNVVTLPTISIGNLSVGLGQQANLVVSLSAAPASAVTVNLSSSDTSKVTVPATVTIPAGSTTASTPVQVTGVGIGSATITGSSSGYTSGTGNITVTAPTLSFSGSPLNITVGNNGNLTLNLTGGQAPAGGLTINLSSSDTGKATVPASINLAAGATSGTVTVTGVAAGTATITASATGIAPATATVNISQLSITLPANTSVPLGDQTDLVVTVSQAPSSALTVNLLSSDTSKVTVPATVTIASGATTGTVKVTGAGIGSATITASASGYTSGTGTVTVPAPTMALTPSPLSVNAGSTANLTLTLTGGKAPAGGLTVNLSSSDTGKATVPASVTLNPGDTSATVTVTGVAAGSATITASANGLANATAQVNVQPLGAIAVSNTSIGLGQQGNVTVTLPSAPGAPVTVNLSSGDTSKVTVAPSVTIAAGSTTGTAQVTGVGIGSSVITASANNYTSGTGTVTVTAPTMALTPSPLNITAGGTGTMTVTLSGGQAPAGGLTVNLSSSDTSKATVPASVSISAGNTSTTFTVTGVANGSATITASATGIANAQATVNVAPQATITIPNVTVLLGGTANLTVTLSAAPASNLTVNLSSSDTSKVTVPATITINSGSTTGTAVLTGTGIGSATITGTASGYTTGTGTATVPAPTMTLTPNPLSVVAPNSATMTVTLTGGQAPAGGLTIGLSSSDITKATVPASVNIGAGGTSATFNVTGVAAGSPTITASAPGIANATATVNVTQQTSGGITFSPPALTVSAGASDTMTLMLPSPAASDVTIGLSSDNPSIATVQSTAKIAAGASTATITVTGVAPGSANINASGGGLTGTAAITVVPPRLTLTSGSVGQNLQTPLTLTVAPASPAALNVVITSSDPSKVLVSGFQSCPGGPNCESQQVTIPVPPGQTTVGGIFVHGLTNSGTATITASAAGYTSGTGTVTLTPSGFQMNAGGSSSFTTSAGALPTPLTLNSVRLDPSGNIAEIQQVRAGYNTPGDSNSGLYAPSVTINNDNSAVGTVATPVTFTGGNDTATSQFSPTATGTANLTAVAPSGFQNPNSGNTVTANVSGASITCPGPSGPGSPFSVGQKLETQATCSFAGGTDTQRGQVTKVTITSNDPSKFLVSTSATGAGSSSIDLVPMSTPGGVVIPAFFVFGVNTGTATFTATASTSGGGNGGFMPGTGNATVTPSGFVIAGPGGIGNGSFFTFDAVTNINIIPAQLNGSGAYVASQALAGNSGPVTVNLGNSNPSVGTLSSNSVTLNPADTGATVQFQRGSPGSTDLTVNTPPGFNTPSTQFTKVTATVPNATLALTSNVQIGQNLETTGMVSITQAAPSAVSVTLMSNDPSQLLLSTSATAAGSASITVTIPAGSTNTSFYLQATGNSIISPDLALQNNTPAAGSISWNAFTIKYQGNTFNIPAGNTNSPYVVWTPGSSTVGGAASVAPGKLLVATNSNGTGLVGVSYTATASGYANGIGNVAILPSGVVFVGMPFIQASVTMGPVSLPVYTVLLDYSNNATNQIQMLRGGMPDVQVTLTSSNPSIATVTSPVTISAGNSQGTSTLTPVSPGNATITITPPSGFSTPVSSGNNKTSLFAIIGS
jgi:uncharacterized protein YjdB